MPDFPIAEKLSPVYRINGELYQHVTASEALSDPQSIRAKVQPTAKIWWFRPIDSPAETQTGEQS